MKISLERIIWVEETVVANTIRQEHTYYTSQGISWGFWKDDHGQNCVEPVGCGEGFRFFST